MKPRSMSEWMVPAARRAGVPRGMGQARHSSSPDVRKLMRSRLLKACWMNRSLPELSTPMSARKA